MALTSKKVLIAPSAFLAFIDRAHAKHPQAAAFFRYFAQEKYQVFAGFLSVEEVYREIFDKISPILARDFLRALTLLSNINILYPTESDTKATLKTIMNYKSIGLSFKDAQMAVLGNRHSIPQICTFDYLHNLFGLTSFYLPI